MKIYLPVRIDFIGGWSDQLEWNHSSAVMNAAVGWDNCYPLCIDGDKIESCVEGIGTGLGISSIIAAGKFIAARKDKDISYIRAVLNWEESIGTKGGWQDQIGGIEGGMKLITTNNHKDFYIQRRDDHPILNHIVLFDTKIRRYSKLIGDNMRNQLTKKLFIKTLNKIVDTTEKCFLMGAEDCALTCIHVWRILNSFVNMEVDCVPKTELIWGYKLVGAGGGGYGIAFVKDIDAREEVCSVFNTNGLWASVPQLLDGVNIAD